MKEVNNEGFDLSDVAILGKIPTVENKIQRTSSIKVSLPANVYYTNVENPTTDLSDSKNNWSTVNSKDATHYLVLLEKLEKDNEVDLSYDIKIAENLEYNVSAELNYQVLYTNSSTGAKEKQNQQL